MAGKREEYNDSESVIWHQKMIAEIIWKKIHRKSDWLKD